MDRQTAIDRITETENLTDGLEDDDANWLLDWGIAHVDGLVTGIKDEDAAGEKLNQLMSVMRTLNQIAADRAAKPPDALAGDIRTFLERYQQTFGAPKAAPPTAAPAASQTSSPSSASSTAPKDGQGPGASPSTTPPAAKAGGGQPQQTPTSGKPSKSTPDSSAKKGKVASTTPPTSPSSATTPSSGMHPANAATKATNQISQASDQASNQAAQAASKITGMNPKEAMQYLLSLAEPSAPVAS
jgi:hypothetical protein